MKIVQITEFRVLPYYYHINVNSIYSAEQKYTKYHHKFYVMVKKKKTLCSML